MQSTGPQQHHNAVERSQKAHQKVCDAPSSVDGPGYGSGDREAQPRRDEKDQELRCFTSVREVCTTSMRQVLQSNVKAGIVTVHAPAGSSRANSAHTQNKVQFITRACPKSGSIAGDCCPYELLASFTRPSASDGGGCCPCCAVSGCLLWGLAGGFARLVGALDAVELVGVRRALVCTRTAQLESLHLCQQACCCFRRYGKQSICQPLHVTCLLIKYFI